MAYQDVCTALCICDQFWENVPKRGDNFFLIYLIKA